VNGDVKAGAASRNRLQSFLERPGIRRPVKFALVGAIGVLVQLAALKVLTALGFHYLWATFIAVEVAVLNNFMWHQRFTGVIAAFRVYRRPLRAWDVSILATARYRF
jgi:putative flippase GtrA